MTPVLGILTLYLNDYGLIEEKKVFARMTGEGKRLGMDVFVFTPEDVRHEQKQILAHVYDPVQKEWSRKWRSFPHLIFDRCRIQKSPRFQKLLQFRSRYGHMTFLNRPLRNKWTIYRKLKEESRFRDKLPATSLYEQPKDLDLMLGKYPLIYLKPINGTGGRGILRIEKAKKGSYLIQGRDQAREIISPQKATSATLHDKLASWKLKKNNYLVQQGIQLMLPDGKVHDYRLLVQKNGEGQWEATGGAGRIGAANSVTSNLHGGGKAVTMQELLSQWIEDEEQTDSIMEEVQSFGIDVADYLEQQYGRLCELALDIAIDRQGQIWLLEVNPKPAREIFSRVGDTKTYQTAIARPLEYALWLHQNNQISKKNTSSPTSGRRTTGGRRSSASRSRPQKQAHRSTGSDKYKSKS